jgi:1,4-alpha-glucan branching enzyme
MTASSSSFTSAVHLLPLDHITGQTPMGGNLLPSGSGATFKVWAPAARSVDVLYHYVRDANGLWNPQQSGRLAKMPGGTWYIPEGRHHGTFLDVIDMLPYLKSLNIN